MYVRGIKFLEILEKSVDISRPATPFQTALSQSSFLSEVAWKSYLGEHLRKPTTLENSGAFKDINSGVETAFQVNSHRTSWSSELYEIAQG